MAKIPAISKAKSVLMLLMSKVQREKGKSGYSCAQGPEIHNHGCLSHVTMGVECECDEHLLTQ
jgi:hypothetical protein